MSIIIAIIDLFSRWWRLFALSTRQAAVVTRCFLDEWIHVRGVPQVMYSDSDPALTYNVCKGLLEALNVKHIVTCRYPQPNGMTERGFVLVGECMRRLSVPRRLLWPQDLPKI